MCLSTGNVDSRSASITALSFRFLTGIDKAGLEDILGVARLRRFPAGHDITTSGCRASSLYLIQSGRARLYHLTKAGELVLLAWVVPGDVAGLAASLKISGRQPLVLWLLEPNRRASAFGNTHKPAKLWRPTVTSSSIFVRTPKLTSIVRGRDRCSVQCIQNENHRRSSFCEICAAAPQNDYGPGGPYLFSC